jgi:hypothetical protein
MHFPYKRFFETGITLFLPMTTSLGFMTGINSMYESTDTDVFCLFRNIITYTTVGIITGLAFPLSIPIISGYTLYRHYTITNRST